METRTANPEEKKYIAKLHRVLKECPRGMTIFIDNDGGQLNFVYLDQGVELFETLDYPIAAADKAQDLVDRQNGKRC